MVKTAGTESTAKTDGARSVRYAREELGEDAIVGAFCGSSRHEGMTAGENGADYVSFGPVGDSALYRGEPAQLELFQWWSEMNACSACNRLREQGELIHRHKGHHVDTIDQGLGARFWSTHPVGQHRGAPEQHVGSVTRSDVSTAQAGG